MDIQPMDRVQELLASVEDKKRKTEIDIAELKDIALSLRRQADEIDQVLHTVACIGSTASETSGYRKNTLGKVRGLDHSYSECHDTAVGGCFWHSDAC